MPLCVPTSISGRSLLSIDIAPLDIETLNVEGSRTVGSTLRCTQSHKRKDSLALYREMVIELWQGGS